MNETKKELCRFCLKIIRDQNFNIIGEITLEMLDVLLIEMDLTIDGKALICTGCKDDIEKCFNFKSVCLCSEVSIAKHIREGFKLDLEEVYLKKKVRRKSVSIPRGHKVCRLCMKISGTVQYLNNTDELIALNDILHKFIPELNLNAVKDPVICETCLLGLQSFSEFITGCLDVEKKINRYCQAIRVAKRQVCLYSVLQFTVNEALDCDIREYAVPRNTGKLEDDKSNIKIKYDELSTTEFDIKKEEIILKSEDDTDSCSSKSINCNTETELINRDKVHYPEAERCDPYKNMNCDKNRNDMEEKPEAQCLSKMIKGENCTEHNGKEIIIGSIMEGSVAEHVIKNEEIEIKSEDDMSCSSKSINCNSKTGLINGGQKHFPEAEQCNLHENMNCDRNRNDIDTEEKPETLPSSRIVKDENIDENHLELFTKHNEKESSEGSIMEGSGGEHDIKNEEIEINSEDDMKDNHDEVVDEKTHRNMHCCQLCTFSNRSRRLFNRHLLMHTTPAEVIVYKCNVCSFISKSENGLSIHNSIVHGYSSKHQEVKCKLCTYKTTHLGNMKKHELTHLPQHEFYKCESCNYVTTEEKLLKHHILKHKNKSEVQKYRCNECSLETRYKQYMKDHKKYIHGDRDPSQIEMYKCEVCHFQCKRRRLLNMHLLSHKSFEGVSIYRCFHCSYPTKYKHNLIKHFKTHMKQSKRHKLKCEVCGREYKSKGSLRTHINICRLRSDPSKIEMYKCELCPRQFKRRVYLEQHLLCHKSFEEVPVYKCFHCSYQTKYKGDLLKHLQTHMNQSERSKFGCEVCGREYKSAYSLRKHKKTRHLRSSNASQENRGK